MALRIAGQTAPLVTPDALSYPAFTTPQVQNGLPPVWVTNSTTSVLSVINQDGSPVGLTGLVGSAQLNQPRGITVVPTNPPVIWVANQAGNSLSRFNLDGSKAGANVTLATWTSPRQILAVFTDEWEIWVAATAGTPALTRYDTSGANLDHFTTNMATCYGLCQVGTNVWCSVGASGSPANAVYVFAIPANHSTTLSAPGSTFSGVNLNTPQGLCVVPTTPNQIWVVNQGGGIIVRLTTAGARITPNLSGFNNPTSLCVVGQQVWVCDSGNLIYRLNFDGSVAAPPLVASQFSSPSGIVVS